MPAGANSSLPSGTRQFATTVDPIIAATYAKIAGLAAGAPLVYNAGSGDYNSSAWNYSLSGIDARNFYTGRLDYNVTQKHHISFTYNYDKYGGVWDMLNNVVPVYPGAGRDLGSLGTTGQHSNRFNGTLALRSALSPRLTNELRGGLTGGTVQFYDIPDSDFSMWRGYYIGPSYTHLATTITPSRRNAPYKEAGDTVSYVKGAHQISAGVTWSQVNFWQESFGTESIPQVSFGAATTDPLITGTSAPFNIAANFPGANSTQMSSMATAYSQLTGAYPPSLRAWFSARQPTNTPMAPLPWIAMKSNGGAYSARTCGALPPL